MPKSCASFASLALALALVLGLALSALAPSAAWAADGLGSPPSGFPGLVLVATASAAVAASGVLLMDALLRRVARHASRKARPRGAVVIDFASARSRLRKRARSGERLHR